MVSMRRRACKSWRPVFTQGSHRRDNRRHLRCCFQDRQGRSLAMPELPSAKYT